MARNMIEANLIVFSRIIEFLDKNLEDKDFSKSARRYISTGEPNSIEKDWIKYLEKKEECSLLPTLKFGFFSFQNEDYLLVIGATGSIEPENTFEEIELNSGLFTVLVAEFSVQIVKRSDANAIYEEIMFSHEALDYMGHDFDSLSKFFEPFKAYKIAKESSLDLKDIHRIAGCYLTCSSEHLILQFNEESIKCYKRLFWEGSKNINFEYIAHSLIQTRWQYVFLDLYRCVEMIFPLISLEKLHYRIHTTGLSNYSINQLVYDVLDNTDWKPKEDLALENICAVMTPSLTYYLRTAFFEENNSKLEEQNAYKYYYKIRNKIVHYRAKHEKLEFSEKSWNDINQFQLLLLLSLYSYMDTKVKD